MTMASGISEARAAMQRPVAFACGSQGGAAVRLDRELPPRPLSAHGNCTSLDVSDDGLLVALGYGDGSVRTWLTNAAEFASGPAHAAGVLLTRFLGESRHLLSVDGAGVVRVWDLSAAAPGPTVSSTYSYASIFSPEGRHVGLANGSTFGPAIGAAAVIDAISGEAVLPPLRHGGVVRSIAFSPDGRSIATGSNNGTARFWDRATGEPAANEMAPTGRPVHLFYSPDGERLLAHEADQDAIPASLWDSRTGRRIASLPETGAVYVASFSPDGRHVQTVTQPAGRVQVWRTSDGQPVRGADWARFDTAAFRSNTELVMVGAQSIEVRALDGRAVARYPAGVRGAESVSVTTDGATFVVGTGGGDDARVHIGRFAPAPLSAMAAARSESGCRVELRQPVVRWCELPAPDACMVPANRRAHHTAAYVVRRTAPFGLVLADGPQFSGQRPRCPTLGPSSGHALH